MSNSSRKDLIDRLRYTFIAADYDEIDALIAGLQAKKNFEGLCIEFFHGCRIDSSGQLIPSGFFADESRSTSLQYAMYGILGRSPDTFLLKHRVTQAKFTRAKHGDSFKLSDGLGFLPRLEILVVRGIGITRLPESIGLAKSLRILDLSFNQFTRFPEIVLRIPRLAVLNLSYNKLTSLPQALGRIKRLRILNLKGNKIQTIMADWHRLQNLQILDFSMNRIQDVPDSLRTMVSLRELRLSYNNLPAAEEAAWEQHVKEKHSSLGIGG